MLCCWAESVPADGAAVEAVGNVRPWWGGSCMAWRGRQESGVEQGGVAPWILTMKSLATYVCCIFKRCYDLPVAYHVYIPSPFLSCPFPPPEYQRLLWGWHCRRCFLAAMWRSVTVLTCARDFIISLTATCTANKKTSV